MKVLTATTAMGYPRIPALLHALVHTLCPHLKPSAPQDWDWNKVRRRASVYFHLFTQKASAVFGLKNYPVLLWISGSLTISAELGTDGYIRIIPKDVLSSRMEMG
jgi:hypothetical protein